VPVRATGGSLGELRQVVVLAALGASAISLALAPLLMPASYSWLEHTTSESAAQGIDGAWLARGGLAAFGVAVLVLAALARPRWGTVGTTLHTAFGALLVATAVFSTRPWEPELPFSALEDLLHSVAATAMGFAFAGGVAVVAFRRRRRSGRWSPRDGAAVAAAVVLPLGMAGAEEFAGALQRLMFLVAYVWYASEAAQATSDARVPASAAVRAEQQLLRAVGPDRGAEEVDGEGEGAGDEHRGEPRGGTDR
jgi:hypothetical protein